MADGWVVVVAAGAVVDAVTGAVVEVVVEPLFATTVVDGVTAGIAVHIA